MDECIVMHMSYKIRAAVVAAFLFLGCVIPGPLLAGNFQVTPIRVVLSAQQASDALKVQNNGSEPVVVQLQTVAWSQENGQDLYQPTSDLVATPPIFTMPPGATQIIRVGLLRGADEKKELSYRLFLQEVPSAPKPDFRGLQVLLRVGLPVFVNPKAKAAPVLNWRAEQTEGDQLRVHLKNEGNAHIQVSDFKLSMPHKPEPIAAREVAAYLLPGQNRSWMVATDPGWRAGTEIMRVFANTDAGSVETEIRLDQP
jgi:fimbrial chaperone protein